MRVDFVTIFPRMFDPFVAEGEPPTSALMASTARNTGSPSITIPGPPPYASSSVERWRSVV